MSEREKKDMLKIKMENKIISSFKEKSRERDESFIWFPTQHLTEYVS